MANAGSAALEVPSLTLIMMFEYVPTLAAVGVPLSCPVLLLKAAHEGWLLIEKVSVLPLGSVVGGVREECWPATTLVAGLPAIVGGPADGAGAVTVMANAGSAALEVPSLTLIMMFEYVPTFADAGVPLSWPVPALKAAHEGWLAIEKVSAPPL